MDEAGRELLARAFAFALRAHGDQTRKGSDVPYASHLLRVAGLVLEHGGDAELAATGLLHDSLEDCDEVEADSLRAAFGDALAQRVFLLSDTAPGDRAAAKSPWPERKRRYLDNLRGADAGTRLVAACDKLDNLRALLDDLAREGRDSLERFNAAPPQLRWYYEAVFEAIRADLPGVLADDLAQGLAELAAWVPVAKAP